MAVMHIQEQRRKSPSIGWLLSFAPLFYVLCITCHFSSINLAVQDDALYTFYNKKITTWTDSEKQCRKDGGQLVTLDTERKWKFIKEEIQNLSNSADNEWFIGLKTGYRNRENWQWITGHQLTNPHWQNEQPSGDGQCAVIAKEYPPGTYGEYNDLSCLASKPFICESEVNTTTGKRIILK